jgi:hypothetical protein
MKQNFTNNVEIRGYVFSHSLQERVTGATAKQPNTKFIMGDINIATDNQGMNIVPVHFTYVTETYASGRKNATFDNLRQLIATGKTYENCGVEASKIRVSGQIETNDFYTRQGELASPKRIRGSFLHFLNAGEAIVDDPNNTLFEADMLALAAVEHDNEDDPSLSYLELKGYVFSYRGDVIPVSFSVSGKDGRNFFTNEDISQNNPYFGKINGIIKSTTIEVQPETDDSQVGFGQIVVRPTTRTFRSWDIYAATINDGMSEDTITADELKKALADREVFLADKKKQQEDYQKTQAGNAGFPSGNQGAQTLGQMSGFKF